MGDLRVRGNQLAPTIRAVDVRPVPDNFRSVILLGAQFRLTDALENGNGDLAVITRE